MFKVNQKVVCIQSAWITLKKIMWITFKFKYKRKGPQKDKIYTVSNIAYNTTHGYPVIQLHGFGDEWFWENGFRPIDENFAEEILENIKEQIKQEELELIEPKTCKQ